MTRAPHYAIAAIVVAALSLAVAPLALQRMHEAATGQPATHVTVAAAGQGSAVTPSSITIPSRSLVVDIRDGRPHTLVQVSGSSVTLERRGGSIVVRFPGRGVYTFTVTSGGGGGDPLAVVVSR